VHLPIWSQVLWGKRLWRPLFRAIADAELVATIHYAGSPEATPTPTGWPAYHVEQLAAAPQIYMSQLVSIIGEGLFDAVPNLRMTLQESGFTWLPGVIWRMDKEWKGLRRGIPWVQQLPSATLRDRLRVCTQPLDGMPADELGRVIDWLGSDDMLIYGSDYPRAHADDVTTLLGGVSEALRANIMHGNAEAHYRL
jgi:predicted TIM-barrel fold metal-dependent hydrolase